MPPRRLVAGAEHSGKDEWQNPTRHKPPGQAALQQILDAVGQQGPLWMLAEDVAMPPDGEGRAERRVHKKPGRFGFLPLTGPPDGKSKLPRTDAECPAGPCLSLAVDVLHGQCGWGYEPHVLWILVEFIEGFRSCCDGCGTFKNEWLHGKNALDLFAASASLARASRWLQISCCKIEGRSLLTTRNPIQSHV